MAGRRSAPTHPCPTMLSVPVFGPLCHNQGQAGSPEWREETELMSLCCPSPAEAPGRRPPSPSAQTLGTVTASRGLRGLWAQAWGQGGT